MAFDLEDFLPYRLYQAAEQASEQFHACYRDRYELTRLEWRVLFNVGQYGPISAVAISARSNLHKTNISRAVQRLEERGWLTRDYEARNRRSHAVRLTAEGGEVFEELREMAEGYNARLRAVLGEGVVDGLLEQLRGIEGVAVDCSADDERRS